MADTKPWQEHARTLTELLGLSLSPVGVRVTKDKTNTEEGKPRICRSILDAASGKAVKVCKENNACFGASWHLGFRQIDDPKVLGMTKKFVVEGEKLFSSYEALDKLLADMEQAPDNKDSCFELYPLEAMEEEPALVIFPCDAEAACRLLTFITFFDGAMPKIKIGGPTCRLAIIYPLVTGEVNISFYDYTARKLCKVPRDILTVSIPYKKIPKIIESIDICSAGRAKIEFPQEFREFLQKRTGVRT